MPRALLERSAYLEVRYESLCRGPRAELQRVFQFIGEQSWEESTRQLAIPHATPSREKQLLAVFEDGAIRLTPESSLSIHGVGHLRRNASLQAYAVEWPPILDISSRTKSCGHMRKNDLKPSELDARLAAPNAWRDRSLHIIHALENEWYRSVFIAHSEILNTAWQVFGPFGLRPVMAPILTQEISSPLAPSSDSLPVAVEVFGTKTYLAFDAVPLRISGASSSSGRLVRNAKFSRRSVRHASS